jgi:hypothetical protein
MMNSALKNIFKTCIVLLAFTSTCQAQPLRLQVKKSAAAVRSSQQSVFVVLDEILMKIRTQYSLPETPLSNTYADFKSRYDVLITDTEELSSRVKDFKGSCTALFAEWKKEADGIHDLNLRNISLDNLKTAQEDYAKYEKRLDEAEANLIPTAQSLNDHILFIKHLLNAETIKQLDPTVKELEKKLASLLEDMNGLLDETQKYIDSI